MSTHVPGSQSFFSVSASLYIGKISQQQPRGIAFSLSHGFRCLSIEGAVNGVNLLGIIMC